MNLGNNSNDLCSSSTFNNLLKTGVGTRYKLNLSYMNKKHIVIPSQMYLISIFNDTTDVN